jgi:hypothetical protein
MAAVQIKRKTLEFVSLAVPSTCSAVTPSYRSRRTCSLKRVCVWNSLRWTQFLLLPVMLLKQINYYGIYFRSTKTKFITRFHTSINICTRQNKMLGYDQHGPGFDSRLGQKIFFSPRRLVRLWGSPGPLFSGYRGSFVGGGGGGRVMKPTTHLHPEPRLRTGGAIILLPHTPSQCGQRKL